MCKADHWKMKDNSYMVHLAMSRQKLNMLFEKCKLDRTFNFPPISGLRGFSFPRYQIGKIFAGEPAKHLLL